MKSQIAEHGHTRHAFRACCNDYVLRARHDRLGRELDRLLGASTLSVDGHGGDALWQLGCQDGIASEGKGLFTRLCHAAEDDVLHRCRINSRTVHDGVQHFGRQVCGMPIGQPSVAAAAGSSYRLNYVGISSHLGSGNWGGRLAINAAMPSILSASRPAEAIDLASSSNWVSKLVWKL
jgi:hypothetical protein